MALTTKQLCLINNLLYSTSPSIYESNPQTSYERRKVADLIESISTSGNKTDTASAKEWEVMVKEIRSDTQLMNVRIEDTYRDTSTGDAGCLLVDPSSNEAVVAFRGTGSGEWKDNFIAGTTMNNGNADPTISVQQQKALDYVESLNLSQYDSVTVTGHSKGGNKAKICALLNDNVDRCVSFDGQGFSDEFFDAHGEDIMRNQNKIENHNVDSDFVNVLLNDVGETTFYKGQNIGDNFAKNHDPCSFFNANGDMIQGPQSADMKQLDYFLNSAIRAMPADQKEQIFDLFGEIANGVFGGGDVSENLKEILLDSRNMESLSFVLAYTIKYEKETGLITSSVSNVLNSMGMSDAIKYIDVVTTIMEKEYLYNLVVALMKNGDKIPDWVFDALRRVIDIPFTNEELRKILAIVSRTGALIDGIEIDRNSYQDLKLPSIEPDTGDSSPDQAGASSAGGADRIIVSTSELQNLIMSLRSAQGKLEQAAQALKQVNITEECGNPHISVNLRVRNYSVIGEDLITVINGYCDVLPLVGSDLRKLAVAVDRTQQMFENVEKQLKDQCVH